jgi:hypothetical protein
VVRVEGRVANTTLTGVHSPITKEHRSRRGVRLRASLALAAVIAVIAIIVAIVSSGSSEPRIVAYHGALPHFAVPHTYHITYAVTQGRIRSTQEMFVRRPFDSYEENITSGKPYLTMAMRLGTEVLRSKGAAASLVYTPLAPSRRDIRLDAVAPYALRTHRLALVGRGRVLGTTCYVFRSAAPLNSGPLEVFGKRSYVDSCVDRRGLVLYEKTTTRGKVTSERRAVRVGSGSSGKYSMSGSTLPPEKGGGAMRALTLDSRPSSGPFWDIAQAPSGFRHVARYVVVPSQPEAFADMTALTMSPTGLPGSLVVSIDDVYVRGANALVIEQGSTVNDAKFSPPSGGTDVDLGPVLGHGQLLLSASASEVAAEPHEGNRFVRVIGTLPPNELIAIARSMTLQPPGTMRRA